MTKPLPLEFVTSKATLGWRDILFGFSKELLDWKDVVELATRAIDSGTKMPEIIDLALVTKETISEIPNLLEKASANSLTNGDSIKKWFYLSLVWLYEHEPQYADPLAEVEDIAAEFGFPEESLEMVTFMPPQGEYQPALHTTAENSARLRNAWRGFVEEHSEGYKDEWQRLPPTPPSS